MIGQAIASVVYVVVGGVGKVEGKLRKNR